MSRATELRHAIDFSERSEEERSRLEELSAAGVQFDALDIARVRTSHAFRTSEWDYVTEGDLEAATHDYTARLERVKREILSGDLTGAKAKRSLRLAESAVRRAERATLVAAYPVDTDDLDQEASESVRWEAHCMTSRHGIVADWTAPSADQIIHASRNPMGAAHWSLRLENMATRLLHAHGVKTAPRPDVWSKRHGTHLALADRVAYKGQVRYALPQPCRYGALGNEPAELGNVETHVTELLTTPARCKVAGQWVPNTGRVRLAFRGHRKVEIRLAESSQRKTATKRAAKRADDVATKRVGKRGPAVDPWNLSPRSLPAAVKRSDEATALAERIESVLRTSTYGAVLTFSDGMVATLSDVSLSTVVVRDVAMPVRELSRRAALAGIDLD